MKEMNWLLLKRMMTYGSVLRSVANIFKMNIYFQINENTIIVFIMLILNDKCSLIRA